MKKINLSANGQARLSLDGEVDGELISSLKMVLKDKEALYKAVSKHVHVLEIINYETY